MQPALNLLILSISASQTQFLLVCKLLPPFFCSFFFGGGPFFVSSGFKASLFSLGDFFVCLSSSCCVVNSFFFWLVFVWWFVVDGDCGVIDYCMDLVVHRRTGTCGVTANWSVFHRQNDDPKCTPFVHVSNDRDRDGAMR